MLALSGALALVSGVANAAMITTWDYKNDAGFIFAEPDVVIESGLQPADVLSVDTHTKLTWGDSIDGLPKSSLVVDSPVSGSLSTVAYGDSIQDSDYVDGTTMTHNNYRIGGPSSNYLSSAVLLDGLRLTATGWDALPPFAGGPSNEIEIGLGFDFIETPNRPESGICVDGKVAGTDFDDVDPNEGAGCDDYFILKPTPGVTFSIDALNEIVEFKVVFDLLDYGLSPVEAQALDLNTVYEVTTRLTGLAPVTDFCGNQTVPCVGFATKELEENNLFAEFAIRAIPEPASIAIFGLGLFGLSMAARRKRQS